MCDLTLPITGMSTDPQVSAPQCTIPDAKSAVTIPKTGRQVKSNRAVCLDVQRKTIIKTQVMYSGTRTYIEKSFIIFTTFRKTIETINILR